VNHFKNGPRFKRGRVDQLLISPTMSWQPLSPSCTTTVRGSGNCRGCHKGSWSQSQLDVMLRRMDKWRHSPGPEEASPKEPDTHGRWRNNRQPG
jgi:hypothetical protein